MRTASILLVSLLTAPVAAQEEGDWRLPFRNPQEAIDPPTKLYDQLRIMIARSQRPDVPRELDEQGIEICDDDAWRAARKNMLELSRADGLDAGYLSLILRKSGSLEDRMLAMYGMFYLPDPSLVSQMINHIPGEPSPKLRQDSYQRAIDFLRVQLPKKNDGDIEEWNKIRVGPAGEKPPKPGEYSVGFDPVPFFYLLTVDSPIDQRQAMWFLGEVVNARPELWKTFLAATALTIKELVVHDDRAVRESARDFVVKLDPENRPAPSIDDTADLAAWLDAVLYDVFPPIRPISPGLVELYRSDDLNKVIELGGKLLRDQSIADPANGKLKNGSFYRGLKIQRAPEPLDKLGLKVGWVVTAINGTPVASCKDVLNVFEKTWRRSYLVEYVAGGKLQAKEFRRAN